MRRLVVELPVEDVIGKGSHSPMAMIDSAEVVQIFKQRRGEFEGIVKVSFKTHPPPKLKDLFPGVEAEATLLNENDATGERAYFVKVRVANPKRQVFSLGEVSGGYVATPFEIRGGMIRLNFIGSALEVKRFMKVIDKKWPHYKVASLTDASFSLDSPLGALTEKQRRVLVTAFNLGYYDMPRKVDGEELARRLNLGASALVAHRRKAERRILAKIING
jgi:hypothetical protein